MIWNKRKLIIAWTQGLIEFYSCQISLFWSHKICHAEANSPFATTSLWPEEGLWSSIFHSYRFNLHQPVSLTDNSVQRVVLLILNSGSSSSKELSFCWDMFLSVSKFLLSASDFLLLSIKNICQYNKTALTLSIQNLDGIQTIIMFLMPWRFSSRVEGCSGTLE